MDAGDVAVATITLARDAGEANLLRNALLSLAAWRMPVAICDGGSPSDFVDGLKKSGFTLTAPAARGLVGQVKASVRLALDSGRRFILYTEPDKLAFFERKVDRFIRAAPDGPDVGIVVAARDDASFATFPRFQQHTEGSLNVLVADLVGTQGDYCYGPFLMNRVLAGYVDSAHDDLGWGWRPFVFRTAHALGYRILQHADEYACPPDQRVDDDTERLHRLRQLRQNVDGLIASHRVMP